MPSDTLEHMRQGNRGMNALAWTLAAASILTSSLTWAAEGPQQLLAATDAIRNPNRPFSVTVTLTEFLSGRQVDTNTLVTYSRANDTNGQFASLVRFSSPPRDAGKLILKNGRDLWFYDPVNKATVRLSPQQRLLGQASNGDVVTVNFSKDYEATLSAEEEVQDGERRTRMAYKLGLKASAPDATYATIELWVDTENKRPLKARFFADSGRLLKTAYYRKFQPQLGDERPTETVIIDGLNPQSVTLMRFSDYAWRAVPDTWLHPDNLPRFQPE
jgi:outer membrane lipoprotein-sorting protein